MYSSELWLGSVFSLFTEDEKLMNSIRKEVHKNKRGKHNLEKVDLDKDHETPRERKKNSPRRRGQPHWRVR